MVNCLTWRSIFCTNLLFTLDIFFFFFALFRKLLDKSGADLLGAIETRLGTYEAFLLKVVFPYSTVKYFINAVYDIPFCFNFLFGNSDLSVSSCGPINEC